LSPVQAESEIIQIPALNAEDQSMRLEEEIRREKVEVITPLRAL